MSEDISFQQMELGRVPLGELKQRAMELEKVPESEWMVLKACRNVDPNIFYGSTMEETAEAKSLCAKCMVSLHCLRYALDDGISYGIWGGLSQNELRRIQKLRVLRRPKLDDYTDIA